MASNLSGNKLTAAAVSFRVHCNATLFFLSDIDPSVGPSKLGLPPVPLVELRKRANSLIVSILNDSFKSLGAEQWLISRQFAHSDEGSYSVVGACVFSHKKRKRDKTIREQLARALIRYAGKLSTFLLTTKDIDIIVNSIDKNEVCADIEERVNDKKYLVHQSDVESDYKALFALYAENSPLVSDEDIANVPTLWVLNNINFVRAAKDMRTEKVRESVRITNKKTIVICPSVQLFENQRVTGVGKSFFARTLLENVPYYLNSADSHGWDDYQSQDVVFLDDLNPDKGRVSADEWKQLTDKWNTRPTLVSSRYHNRAVVASKFIATTPLPIEFFCAKLAPDMGGSAQIARRIDYCFEVSLDENGNSVYKQLEFDDKTMTWSVKSDFFAKFIRTGNDVTILDKDNQFENLQKSFLYE